MTETRLERKERTRRALLDAALELCEESSFVGVSLRQVTGRAGIVPTAFYRHFESLDALGLALVEESFVSLRSMLRAVRRTPATSFREIVDRSVDTVLEHVLAQQRHFAFIARERSAGPVAVRDAVREQVALVTTELAHDLLQLPGTEHWTPQDMLRLSDLIVTAMVRFAEVVVETQPRPDERAEAVATARAQLRMVLIGALNWRSSSTD